MSIVEPTIADHFADARQQHESALFGMWLFLLTEVMLFGGLFTAYAVYRYQHPASFAAAAQHLDLWLGTVNTVVLISSSLTMALAHHAARHGRNKKSLLVCLTLTALLGMVFLGIKAIEYRHKFQDRLVPGENFHWPQHAEHHAAGPGGETTVRRPLAHDESTELFYSLYFVMTGLHAVHMVVGVGLLMALIGLAQGRRLRPVTVELTGMYWHLVDIVWIFLFPLLYLIGRHQ